MAAVSNISHHLEVDCFSLEKREEIDEFIEVLAKWKESVADFFGKRWEMDDETVINYEPVAIYSKFHKLMEGLKSESLPGVEVIVLRDEHHAIEGGAVVYYPSKDRENPFSEDQRRVDLFFMVTNSKNIIGAEEKRTAGVGRQIINQLEIRCKKAGLIGVTVESTEVSHEFYERVGFSGSGYRMIKDFAR